MPSDSAAQVVLREQCNGRTLACINCNRLVGDAHHILCYEYAKARTHLRDHLTDGHWHDECLYCQRRRAHGGTGLESQSA